MREKHFKFIEQDLENRGETLTSEIFFMGAIYSMNVKRDGAKRSKKVVYSAADNDSLIKLITK
jgi:hypothetical protein